MKLLAGYDASPESRIALEDLRNAGLPPEGELVLLGVSEFYTPPPLAGEPINLAEEAAAAVRAEAEALCEAVRGKTEEAAAQLRRQMPGWTVRTVAVSDSPAWGLLKHDLAWHPDLICVGAPHHSRLEQLFFGSVAQKVVSHAHTTVRIGRKGPEGGPLRLLLAMDCSADACAASATILSRQWPAGTEVCIVAVTDSRFVSFPGAMFNPLYGDQGKARLDQMLGKFHAAGLKVTEEILDGKPARVLLEKAKAWDAHCIFAGAGGHGAVERLLLGSVSSALAARAACSVEIVRQRKD